LLNLFKVFVYFLIIILTYQKIVQFLQCHLIKLKYNMSRKPKAAPKTAVPTPAVSSVPKKRGRKPGSKNKVQVKKRSRRAAKPVVNVFEAIEKQMKAMAGALKKAKAAAEKQIAKVEAKAAKNLLKAETKTAKKVEKLKKRMKAKRGRKPGRPAAVKPAARRGRPPKNAQKRGRRPRKGQPTKKSIILDYMKTAPKPVKSADLIAALFSKSGESDKKRFYQGMYTTLTQIYKSGELKKVKDGISLAK